MTTSPQTLEHLATTATVEDIDACLKTLNPHDEQDKKIINFWLDLRLTVMHNNEEVGSG